MPAAAGLHYREAGQGPPVVLLHAGSGLDGSTLSEAAVPLLAIGGREDRATPPAATIEIAQAARRGAAVVLGEAGHFPYAELPDAYFGVLGGWLEAHESAA